MLVSIIATDPTVARPLHGILSVNRYRVAVSRGWKAVAERYDSHGEATQVVIDLSLDDDTHGWLEGQRLIDWLWHPAAADVRHCVSFSGMAAGRDDNDLVRRVRQREFDLRNADIPTTIVRGTHLYEQMSDLIRLQSKRGVVTVPDTLFQPIAAFDVAYLLAAMIDEDPESGTVEVAGPECAPLSYLLQRFMDLSGDTRTVVETAGALLLGSSVGKSSLVPAVKHRRGHIGLAAWFQRESSYDRSMLN